MVQDRIVQALFRPVMVQFEVERLQLGKRLACLNCPIHPSRNPDRGRTLLVNGDTVAVHAALKPYGISGIRSLGGIVIGRSQAQQAIQALTEMSGT